jgi:bacterioferritin-associated ferredoxin
VIVCHCQVVNDGKVTAAIEAGARTLAGLCRSTGAGKNCGACVFSLKRLLCEHGNPLSALSPEVEVAAS